MVAVSIRMHNAAGIHDRYTPGIHTFDASNGWAIFARFHPFVL